MHYFTQYILSNPILDSFKENLSAANGCAGMLYVLEHAAQLGHSIDPTLQKTLLNAIQPNILLDKKYDLLGGVAGLILVLTKMQKRNENPHIQQLIQESIQHLLNEYPNPAVLPESLITQYHYPAVGFSHGVSGIVWALLQAAPFFSNQKTQAWIQDGLIYLKKIHDQHSHFPDSRIKHHTIQTSASSGSWCHGQVGIGLLYEQINQFHPELANNSHCSLIHQQIYAKEKPAIHYLCCGSLGELDFLLESTKNQPDHPLQAQREKKTIEILHDVEHNQMSQYALSGFATTLFQGKAGIAYSLLRIVAPKEIPCILLFD